MQALPENFLQTEIIRPCLLREVQDDAVQYLAVHCMLTARWIPPAILSGEHPGTTRSRPHPYARGTEFGFGTSGGADCEKSLSHIRRIGVGGPERAISACTEIEQSIADKSEVIQHLYAS